MLLFSLQKFAVCGTPNHSVIVPGEEKPEKPLRRPGTGGAAATEE
jgi:hypothetical protein